VKILVDLNSSINAFSIQQRHKEMLRDQFPAHDFIFMESYRDFKENVSAAEAALVWVFPEHLFAKAPALKAIFTPAAGRDWVAEDPSGNVSVHFSSFHGHIISESFLSMMLYVNNNLAKAVENQSLRSWDRNAFGKRIILQNQSLLIIGCGSIGQVCADKAISLGMKVAGVKRHVGEKNAMKMMSFSSLASHISEYDFILNLLPGGEATEKLIDSSLIEKMKDGVSFFNFGRGTTIDEVALEAALKSGKIAFAGLDVTYEEPLRQESELWGLDNVLLTPHSSCCYEDYLDLFIEELKEKL
jgi:D-2-hydroxyacid dehydrogenase (NADP+)